MRVWHVTVCARVFNLNCGVRVVPYTGAFFETRTHPSVPRQRPPLCSSATRLVLRAALPLSARLLQLLRRILLRQPLESRHYSHHIPAACTAARQNSQPARAAVAIQKQRHAVYWPVYYTRLDITAPLCAGDDGSVAHEMRTMHSASGSAAVIRRKKKPR